MMEKEGLTIHTPLFFDDILNARGMWHIAYDTETGKLKMVRARKYITSKYTFKTRKDGEAFIDNLGADYIRHVLFGGRKINNVKEYKGTKDGLQRDS